MSNPILTPDSNREVLLETVSRCKELMLALGCENSITHIFKQFKVKSINDLTDGQLIMLINMYVGACSGLVA